MNRSGSPRNYENRSGTRAPRLRASPRRQSSLQRGLAGEESARILRLASSCTDETEEVWKNFLWRNLVKDEARQGREVEPQGNGDGPGVHRQVVSMDITATAVTASPSGSNMGYNLRRNDLPLRVYVSSKASRVSMTCLR